MAMMDRIVRFFDLPEDTTQDLPRVIWIAQSTMTLQGRHRLIVCEDSKTIFATTLGHLVITGEGLSIGSIEADRTEILGKITCICYEK